ncbi:2-oxo acid dehydrogenase subunit E2 [Kocuria rhizophila]|nr:2-oxo acid dehydrogenase subunit E2 [Kocuria rhizophila]
MPSVKAAEPMSFPGVVDLLRGHRKRGRDGALTMESYSGTTVSLTNPGGIGTVHSVQRLSKGQACIIGVGALDYPRRVQGRLSPHDR